jgi:hypothetical protein
LASPALKICPQRLYFQKPSLFLFKTPNTEGVKKKTTLQCQQVRTKEDFSDTVAGQTLKPQGFDGLAAYAEPSRN